jgi:hypothetical protein
MWWVEAGVAPCRIVGQLTEDEAVREGVQVHPEGHFGHSCGVARFEQ